MGHPSPSIEKLRVMILRRWWAVSGLLWLTVAPLSLWSLRPEIAQLRQYFTWSTVRLGLGYNRPAAIGLGLCVGLTVALLVNESRNILWGMTKDEQQRLEKLCDRIEAQGPSHPLWRRLHRD
ncbi:MAG: hypothetical protein DCF21_22565 [Leptolyngbya sp.]|uniref:Uncharacterized protein n=1 Tax=Shackletoniella antarctica TaxID=268115 RepID=A0A2W4WI14_9CYAN|nr:MAG: hypothetical protein DCF17_10565 [Shackletoniella antarctica]PZV06586.1 MAG: hypothetical protein DCF21_22565 [Leptolyngbya sp.]